VSGIYAISLHQPWASFIAHGLKQFETRSWSPPRWLIGQRIAIHAAKKAVNADDRQWATDCGVDALPFGAVVCTAVLAGAYECGGVAAPAPPTVMTCRQVPGSPNKPFLRVDEYGDYASGRWAWWLTDIEPLDPPVAMRGRQGFWKCEL
jgi:hypothetical protein